MLWYWVIVGALVLVTAAMHRLGIARFDNRLHWSAWIAAGLVVLSGGWMAFEGARALIFGDYVTPATGQFAGSLGPWAGIVDAVGIPPRSTLMKSIFIIYGLAYMGSMAALLLGVAAARWLVLAMAGLGLWCVPFGTLTNLIVITLLLLPTLGAQAPRESRRRP